MVLNVLHIALVVVGWYCFLSGAMAVESEPLQVILGWGDLT